MTDDVEDFLSHYGVKGMKWGVRRDNPSGASRSVNRQAAKDAKEYARAKMYYGEGAGTRRKLINKSVEDRKKNSSSYGKAFDAHLAKQDISKHAQKARKERSKTDRSDRRKQRSGALLRQLTREQGTQAALVSATLAGAAFLNSPRGRALLNSVVDKGTTLVDNQAQRRGAAQINDWLKNNT